MADNTQANVGSGGDIIATDDIGGGVKVQRVKTTWGPDGTMNDADVASGKPLPVQLRSAGGDEVTLAHDAVDAGGPIKVGHRAIAHGTNPTAVAAGDRTDWFANRAGVPWVMGGHPNILTLEVEYTSAQTNAAIITVGSGVKIVVTQIQALCANANSVDVAARIGFATATTPTTTGVVLTHPGIAPGSGVSRGSGAGILGVGGDGEDLRITSGAPTSGALRVLVSYYTIES